MRRALVARDPIKPFEAPPGERGRHQRPPSSI
jgi:hypothetical protein